MTCAMRHCGRLHNYHTVFYYTVGPVSNGIYADTCSSLTVPLAYIPANTWPAVLFSTSEGNKLVNSDMILIFYLI